MDDKVQPQTQSENRDHTNAKPNGLHLELMGHFVTGIKTEHASNCARISACNSLSKSTYHYFCQS